MASVNIDPEANMATLTIVDPYGSFSCVVSILNGPNLGNQSPISIPDNSTITVIPQLRVSFNQIYKVLFDDVEILPTNPLTIFIGPGSHTLELYENPITIDANFTCIKLDKNTYRFFPLISLGMPESSNVAGYTSFWRFGDGKTSVSHSPVHTFVGLAGQKFTVSLSARDALGQYIRSKQNLIVVE